MKHCNVCSKGISASNWAKHVKSKKHQAKESGTKKTHPCSDCDYEGPTRQALHSHKNRVHGDGSLVYYYFCEVCDLPIRNQAKALSHRHSLHHRAKILAERPDLCDPLRPKWFSAEKAKDLVIEKKTIHKRNSRHERRGNIFVVEDNGEDFDYTPYLEEDFYLACDPSDFREIVVQLLQFCANHELDMDSQMEFSSCKASFEKGELDDDATIRFIRQMADSIHDLLKNEEGDEEEGDGDDEDESNNNASKN